MDGEYYIDLKTVTLSDYEKELELADLLPSRKILKEEINQRFSILRGQGILDLNDLMSMMKTPDKLKNLAAKTGIPEEYLTILKREIASSQPKPVNLADFQGVSVQAVSQLEGLGIKNTLQMFAHVKTKEEREALAGKTGVPYQEILELAKLTDVSRIKWVGANFARLLVDSGCDTVEKAAGAEYRSLYTELMAINEEKKYFKGKFGLNDMKLCVDAAKKVPRSMQFE